MKRFLLLLLFAIGAVTVFAQEERDLARFYVVKASVDGVDVTSQVLEGKMYTVFYERGGEMYMANVWEKRHSQSWGPMLRVDFNSYPETATDYKYDEFVFDWEFRNTYDEKSGVCKVAFFKIYKPNGVESILKMVEPSGETSEFVGYMEGSLNF